MGSDTNKETFDFSIETTENIKYLKVSPNKKLLLVGYGSKNIKLFNLETKSFVADVEGCTFGRISKI